MYYIEDDHEAIIKSTLFDMVQEELKKESNPNSGTAE